MQRTGGLPVAVTITGTMVLEPDNDVVTHSSETYEVWLKVTRLAPGGREVTVVVGVASSLES